MIVLKTYYAHSPKNYLVYKIFSYVDRLKSCNIELLELRRIHSDLIMLYQILNGYNLCEY